MSILQGCDLHSVKLDNVILVHHSHANSAPDRPHATACCLWRDCTTKGEMYLKCKFSLDPKVIARDLPVLLSGAKCRVPPRIRISNSLRSPIKVYPWRERWTGWRVGQSENAPSALFRPQRTNQIICGIVDTPGALHGVEDQRQNPPNFFPITN